LLLQRPGAPDERHLRVRLSLVEAAGSAGFETVASQAPQPTGELELRFVDQRMFGGLLVSAGGATLPPEIAHIARDPLDDVFDDEAFVRKVRTKVSGLKRVLLDQTVVSGIGNIYADEALWRAGVHGDRRGEALTGRQVRDILARVREVMGSALAQGGTSFDALYVNVNGESGYFDRSLEAYGREGRPCSRCHTPIRRVPFANRSSYFCPRCQPAPRARLATSRH